MSSTNRSNSRNSHISDYYITPIKDIKLFLTEFNKVENIDWKNIQILDPCAGGDENHPMSYPEVFKEFASKRIYTLDIRKDSKAEKIQDFLSWDFYYNPDMIITNPPFNKALDIIKKSLNYVKDDGWVIMLLRLNFFGSKQRKEFWDKYMPKYVFIHHNRIGFTEDGKKDSIEYMHCCWQKNNYPEFCKLKVI